MSRITKTNATWTLTVLRDGKQGEAASIEDAQYRFGRSQGELCDSPSSRLSSGLVSAIAASGIVEAALESGFLVDMSSRREEGEGWLCFQSTVTVEYRIGQHIRPSRTLYSLTSGNDSTLEFVSLNPRENGRKLTPHIWVRAIELSLPTVAWAIENGIFVGEESRQLSLSEWIGPPANPPIFPSKDILPMPGPSSSPYGFL